jgi:hypothetical protein
MDHKGGLEISVKQDGPLSAPSFLITIDTEGDNLWNRPHEITTQNARFLPRFQRLCERFSFKPTYLTNYEMANDPFFVEFGRDILARNSGEIGMHLHPLNSPPIKPLTANDHRYQPYLFEYPTPVIREKIVYMNELLTENFQCQILSHRAGRWAFNEIYARILVDLGYRIDCSVTPHLSWREYPGDPSQDGGADFFQFPEDHYFVDLDDIGRAGQSDLLEIPLTVFDTAPTPVRLIKKYFRRAAFIHRLANKLYPTIWLRPAKGNRRRLFQTVALAERLRKDHLMFMLHSSEFMAGGSPTFLNERDIERLYADLEALFERIARSFKGQTLTEFYHLV